MICMIATIRRDNSIIKYRLLNTITSEVIDETSESLYYDIANGRKRLENLIIESNRLQGSNGSIDRYPTLNQQLERVGKNSVVILYRDKNGDYICSDYTGQIERLSEHEMLKYGKNEKIANGKVDGSSISPISGEFKVSRAGNNIAEQIRKYKAKCKLMGLPDIQFMIRGGEVALIEVPSDIQKLIVPGFVTKIEAKLFNHNNTLETVLISEGLKVLGDWTFSQCSKLKKVSLPSTLEHIRNYAFMGCTKIESIDIPNGVKRIDACAFDSCRKLRKINIPEGVEILGNNIFEHCESLEEITIPGSIKNIEEYSFSDCLNLRSVTIEEGVTSIDKYTFNGCRSLKTIKLPRTLSIIGDGAFDMCESLESIILPENLSFIGNYAFEGCKSLKNIIIPNRTAFIGNDVFIGCNSLQNVKIPKKLKCNLKEIKCNYELY